MRKAGRSTFDEIKSLAMTCPLADHRLMLAKLHDIITTSETVQILYLDDENWEKRTVVNPYHGSEATPAELTNFDLRRIVANAIAYVGKQSNVPKTSLSKNAQNQVNTIYRHLTYMQTKLAVSLRPPGCEDWGRRGLGLPFERLFAWKEDLRSVFNGMGIKKGKIRLAGGQLTKFDGDMTAELLLSLDKWDIFITAMNPNPDAIVITVGGPHPVITYTLPFDPDPPIIPDPDPEPATGDFTSQA